MRSQGAVMWWRSQQGAIRSRSWSRRWPVLACVRRPIVFRPAAGVTPTVNWSRRRLVRVPRTDAADNVVLRGFKLTWGLSMWGDVENVTLDWIDGGSFSLEGASNVTIRNSDWGPCTPSGSFDGGPADCRNYYPFDPRSGQPRISAPTMNVLLENNAFHDMVADHAGAHWECLWVGGGRDVTFRGNRFDNCETNAVALGDDGNDNNVAGTWLFENNWCGRVPRDQRLLQVRRPPLRGDGDLPQQFIRPRKHDPQDEESGTRRAASSSAATSSAERIASEEPCTRTTSRSAVRAEPPTAVRSSGTATRVRAWLRIRDRHARCGPRSSTW